MTVLARTVVESTGYIGAPGYNIIHWVSATGTELSYTASLVEDWHSKLFTALYSYQSYLVDDADFAIQAECILFNDDDGMAIGSVTQSGTPPTFAGGGSYTESSRGDCLTIRHHTSRWYNGRRLSGRTFVGPMTRSMFKTDGQVIDAYTSGTPGFWAPLTTGLDGLLVVWHRPSTPTASDGTYGVVTGSTCNSTPGSLRSRKT